MIVGGSLAGCTTAILLGREGLRVALVEKQPDPAAFKRICSHFIQASAVPTLERLDLLEPIVAAGGAALADPGLDARGAGSKPPPDEASLGVNLRRELLDPLVREAAAATPGVELHARPDGDAACCATARRSAASSSATATAPRRALRAQLVVGADGRDSQIAELAGVKEKILPHGRFAYGGYFEGPPPELRARQLDLDAGPALGGGLPAPTAASSSTRRCRPRTGCRSSSATRPRR